MGCRRLWRRRCKVRVSPLNKSALYLEALPAFNRGAVALPNYDRRLRELRGLERRVHRSRKDSVDHPLHGSDDHANALCGALYIALHEMRRPQARFGAIAFGTTGQVTWHDPEPRTHSRLRWITVDVNGKEVTR